MRKSEEMRKRGQVSTIQLEPTKKRKRGQRGKGVKSQLYNLKRKRGQVSTRGKGVKSQLYNLTEKRGQVSTIQLEPICKFFIVLITPGLCVNLFIRQKKLF